jgi:serine/threonine protein kinase
VSDEGGAGGPVGKTVPGAPDPDALATPAPRPADAAAAKRGDADVLPRGTMVDGKYAVDRVLGAGGMGVVYLARDVHTGIEVVLKAIRPHLAHRGDIRERVITEGRALAQIDHPNVVHLKAVVAAPNGLFLVMPFIDGESLDKTLKRAAAKGEKIAVNEALRLFRMILAGVGAAHGEGVIHRDLKPANVLLRKKDGVAKVTDFGIAKGEEQARAGQGQTKGVIGSLWYMSPEQVQGKRDLDKRVDIYSLGVVLFELLTGHVPFQGDSSYDIMKAHVDQPMPKVRSERADVPAWIDDLLAKACAKSRDDRFPTCEAFLEALDAAHHAHAAQVVAPAATAAPTSPTSKAPAASATETAHEAASGASTGPATSLTGEGARSRATGAPRKRPSRAPTIALLGFGLIGGGLALALFLTGAGTRQRPHLRETSPWATASGAAPGGTGSPIATSSAGSPVSSASSAPGAETPPEVTLSSLQGRGSARPVASSTRSSTATISSSASWTQSSSSRRTTGPERRASSCSRVMATRRSPSRTRSARSPPLVRASTPRRRAPPARRTGATSRGGRCAPPSTGSDSPWRPRRSSRARPTSRGPPIRRSSAASASESSPRAW